MRFEPQKGNLCRSPFFFGWVEAFRSISGMCHGNVGVLSKMILRAWGWIEECLGLDSFKSDTLFPSKACKSFGAALDFNILAIALPNSLVEGNRL